ncbi:MAG: NfeD family protein [Alphaproteobacteria bacterium]|nr:NfeD family protein [Alphaproteobacteria bacterium]
MSGFTVEFWHWFALAGVLLLPEMMMPGVAFLFLAIGAFVTGVFKLVWHAAPLDAQLGVFAVVSIAAFAGMRSWIRQIFKVREGDKLNERGGQLVGTTITLSDAIRNGEGRVRVGDGSWNVNGPDMASGARVRVIAVDGATLKVEPAP